MQILYFLAALLVLQYAWGVFVLLTSQKYGHIALSPVEPAAIPGDPLRYLMEESRKLARFGFEVRAHVQIGGPVGGYAAYLVAPQGGDTALVAQLGVMRWTDLCTRFADGVVLNTSNVADPGVYARHPRYLEARLPHLGDVRALYEIHQLRREREKPAAAVVPPPAVGNEIAVLTGHVNEAMPLQVEVGTLRPVGEGFRLTLKGALIAVWRQSPTSNWLCKLLVRRRALALESAIRAGVKGGSGEIGSVVGVA